MGISIVGAGRALGHEILGVDARAPLDAQTVRAIEDAVVEHSVVVLRNQHLSPEQHKAFAARFGTPAPHVASAYVLPGHPEVYIVSNIVENGRNIGVADAGPTWHSDFSYLAAPASYSMLHAIEVPVIDGVPRGDTSFASTFAAYDALDPARRRELEPLRITYSYGKQYDQRRDAGSRLVELNDRQRAQTPEVAHPIVRTHPKSGRKCLFVSDGPSTGVVGMDPEEGRALIRELIAHCSRPEFVYRHKWQVGDLVIWDNVSSLHRANSKDYALPHRRRMHRVTLAGSAPF